MGYVHAVRAIPDARPCNSVSVLFEQAVSLVTVLGLSPTMGISVSFPLL